MVWSNCALVRSTFALSMRSKRISRHTHTKLEKKFNNISKRKVVVQWVTGSKAATLHISRRYFYRTLWFSSYLIPSKNEKQFHVVPQPWALLHSLRFNPKRWRGGGQSTPLVFWLAAISHKRMLWSQKFLTLSINIPKISW